MKPFRLIHLRSDIGQVLPCASTSPLLTGKNRKHLRSSFVLLLFIGLFWNSPVSYSRSFPPDSLNWQTDLLSAQQLARETGKSILLVFSGSDWCRPCMQFEKEVLHSEAFADFSEQQLVLLRADFPRSRKRQLPPEQQVRNAELAERYNPKGAFPLIVLLDPEGNLLDQIGYRPGGPQAYLSHWKSKWQDE